MNYLIISWCAYNSFSVVKSTARAKATHMPVSSLDHSAIVETSSLPKSSWLNKNLSAIRHALGTIAKCAVGTGG